MKPLIIAVNDKYLYRQLIARMDYSSQMERFIFICERDFLRYGWVIFKGKNTKEITETLIMELIRDKISKPINERCVILINNVKLWDLADVILESNYRNYNGINLVTRSVASYLVDYEIEVKDIIDFTSFMINHYRLECLSMFQQREETVEIGIDRVDGGYSLMIS